MHKRLVKFRYLIPLDVFIALVVVFARGLQLDPTRVPSPFIDKPAPDFDLPILYNPENRFTKETFTGRVSLHNVFASWFTACRLGHPLLWTIDRKAIAVAMVQGRSFKLRSQTVPKTG